IIVEKQYSGRFSSDFVEARRGDLERWLNRVVRHPLIRATNVLIFFLGCEDDSEWKRRLPSFLAAHPTPGPSFYSSVFHPQFNIDLDDASSIGRRFRHFVEGAGERIGRLRAAFTQVREAGAGEATASRAFSYALLALITPGPSSTTAYRDSNFHEDSEVRERLNGTDLPETDESGADSGKSWNSARGAWCWRDDCSECVGLSKAFQKVAENYQAVADLQDNHARRFQLSVHEAIKDAAHPYKLYAVSSGYIPSGCMANLVLNEPAFLMRTSWCFFLGNGSLLSIFTRRRLLASPITAAVLMVELMLTLRWLPEPRL
ncbi:hypothetical protein DL93DRAFT_2088206, partial [Clavulina sp. PMI_390]